MKNNLINSLRSFIKNKINEIYDNEKNEINEDEKNKLIAKLRFYIMNAIDENKDVDSNLIFDIIDTLKNYYELEHWIKHVVVDFRSNTNNQPLGIHDKYTDELTFNIAAIKYKIETLSDIFRLSVNEKIYFLYCELLIIILHEIEHANQHRTFHSNDKDLESLIIQASYCISFTKLEEKGYKLEDIEKQWKKTLSEEFHKENYNISPIERLAEIKSLNITEQVFNIKNDDERISSVRSYIAASLKTIYENGYDRYLSPTITYIQRFNPFADLEEILDKSKGLSYKERIIYGLQISNNEQAENENKETTNGKILIR